MGLCFRGADGFASVFQLFAKTELHFQKENQRSVQGEGKASLLGGGDGANWMKLTPRVMD